MTIRSMARPLFFALMTCLLLGCARLPPRANEMAALYPGGFPSLSEVSKKTATAFGTGMMGAFENLGVSGIEDAEGRAAVKEELMDPLLHFRTGTTDEKLAHAGALLVCDAMDYLGMNMPEAGSWSDPKFNKLLRLTPGVKPSISEIAAGMKELLVDYIELVDPDLVERARLTGTL